MIDVIRFKLQIEHWLHIVFGIAVIPYILYVGHNEKKFEIKKAFLFLENMAMREDVKAKEVLDFIILERIADERHDILGQCKQYMGENTRE